MSEVLPAEVTPPAATDVASTPAPEGAAPPAEAAKPAEAAPAEQPKAEGEPKDPLRDPVTGQFVMRTQRTEKLVSQIGDLTRTKHDLNREIARLKSEAQQLHKQLGEQPQIDPADFDAQQRHQIKAALNEQKLQDKVEQIKALTEEREGVNHREISNQAETLRAQIPDIDRIFLSPQQGGPVITPIMAEAISRAENSALIAYHLATKPQEAMRLAQADALTVAVEIGRIAAEVKPAPVRRVSQAPQPVQTVSGAPGNPQPDLGALSFRDYERVMNEKERARRA